MASTKSSSLGRANPNSRSSELTDPMRRSFSGNPFAKPSLIPNPKTCLSTTPTNAPSDLRRNSVGGREVAGSSFRDHDDKENGKDQILKPSKARSPAASSKSAKNFMSPTISASSKVTVSPRKKVLVERNEPVRTSVPSTTEAKSIIRKVTFVEPLQCSDLKPENGVEQKKCVALSFDGFPVPSEETLVATSLSGEAVFDMNAPFNSKNDTESSFETVADEPDCVVLDQSFKLSPTPPTPPPVSSTFTMLAPLDADPLMPPPPSPLDAAPVMPPYDPKTNYLSPRPQFLHYKPKPRIELYKERELGDSFMSGSFSDTEVTEDTQSEGSQKESEDVSSGEVVEEEAGISEPSPARTSLADETVEAREVPKPRILMKSKVIITLLLLLSVAFISVSVTNSPVMDHTVFQDLYKVYESSYFSEYARANFDRFSEYARSNFDQFSELGKAKFDGLARNFHTWFTKSLSSISELISNVRGVHDLGHFQYYNLTVLHECNVVDGPGEKFVIETPEVYPLVLKSEERDTASEIDTDEDTGDISADDYESVYEEQVQQDTGVTTAIENASDGEKFIIETPEVYPLVLKSEERDTASEMDTDEDTGDISADDYESVYEEQVQQDTGVTTAIKNASDDASGPESQPATMIESDQPLQLAEVSNPNHSSEFVLDLNDQPSLDAKAANIHSEVCKTENLEAKMAHECDARVNVDKQSDVGIKDQPGLDSEVAEIHAEAYGDNDIELTEAAGESASIDVATEAEERLKIIDFSPHMVLYLLLCGGTIFSAAAAFNWSRKGTGRSTRITCSGEQPLSAKAFHANSLLTPKEEPSYQDKQSLRNGPTEIEMHGESCPSEMSSIQKSSSYKQKVVKELNEVHSLEKKTKKTRESLASSSSDYSMRSPSISYGSYTTYEKIQIKNGHGDEETITPVRRSSRIRSQATSPL